MGKRPQTTIGIDFGTSTTLIAENAGGRLRTIPIGETTPWLPSLVGRAGGQWVVGDAADRLPINDILRSVKNCITNNQDRVPDGQPLSGVSVSDVVGQILKASVSAAQAAGVDTTSSVVRMGCPAMWVGDQRQMLAELAHEAGLKTHVDDMIDEPIGAGVDWVWDRFLNHNERVRGKALVVDYGGGTLDVALLDVEFETEPIITVLSSRGRHGAGDEVDDALAARISEHLLEAGASSGRLDDPLASAYIRREARSAKVRLSRLEQTRVKLDAPFESLPEVVLTRAELEDVLDPQLRETISVIYLALREAHLRGGGSTVDQVKRMDNAALARDIQYVVLVGGMSMVPCVRTALQEHFLTARVDQDADELAVTTKISRGFARSEAYESLNLHRPGLDIVLQWQNAAGQLEERTLFPAFTPVFDRYQIQQGSRPQFENILRQVPVGGRLPGRVVVRSTGRQPVSIRVNSESLDGIPVELDAYGGFHLRVTMDGQISMTDSLNKHTSLRVASWPYVRFSGQRRDLNELIAVESSGSFADYRRPFDWRHK